MIKLDSADTIFFERELMQLLAQQFDTRYVQLKGRTFVGTGEMIDPGQETVRRIGFDSKGQAKRIANPSDDLPQVQVKGAEAFSTMYSYGLACSWSDQEVRAGRLVGRLPEQMRMTAVRKALAQQLDEHIAVGDSDVGNLGLLNQTGTHDVTSDMHAWLNGATTTTQILDDLFEIADKSANATSDVESTKRIIFPSILHRKLSSTARSTTSDTTILKYFMDNRPGLDIQTWERSNLAGSGGKHRVVAYDPGIENLRLLMSVEFAMDVPQRKNFAQLVNCYMRNGGVLLTYPKTMTYADIATS